MRRFNVFLSLLLIGIISLFSGCNSLSQSVSENQQSNTVATSETGAKSTDAKDTTDYLKYKGDWKLKVTGDEELYLMTSMEEYLGSTGINITEINDGTVKGSIYSIQGAPSFRQAEVAFEGQIEDGKLSASYEDEAWLYSGKIDLNFGKEMISASITRNEAENTPMWGIPEGEFSFIKPIRTEKVNLLDQDKGTLEKFLLPTAKDRIKPFAEGSLTDEIIINFVGYNLALGFIDTNQYGDKVQNNADIIFDESVMNDLAKKYFGVEVKNPKTVDIITYKNGKYTVPALGGISEYPNVQLLLKDTENEGTYYAIVDYMSYNPQDGKKLEYQHLIKLQKNDGYTIKAIKEIENPINYELLNQSQQ